MYALKLIHISCAVISFSGFFLRGLLMLYNPGYLQKPWVRVTPHIVDTALLVSAVALAAGMGLSPSDHPWLAAKIAALLCYIALGMVALRFGRTRKIRCMAWILAMLTFLYIVSVAASKSVAGVFVLL